jgi:hypothetical protein
VLQFLKAGQRLVRKVPLRLRLTRRSHESTAAPGLSPISWARFDWQIRNNAKLRQHITETLSDPESLPPNVFDLRQVHALLTDHLANRAQHRFILFALLTFGRWHKKHGRH